MMKPALLLMVGRIVGYIVTFALPITLSRLFSMSEYGTYKLVFMISNTLLGMGQIGMAESLYYFLPRSPEHAGRYVANTIAMLACSGVLLVGITWVGAAPLAHWWSNPELVVFLPLVGLSTALMLTAISFETVLVSQNEYRKASVLYGTTDLARAVILLGAAVLTRDLRWLLVAASVYAGLRCLAMTMYLMRRFKSELRLDYALWVQQLKYALPYTIACWASFNPQGFLLASWVDAAGIAIYTTGCLDIPIVDVAASTFGNVLMVRLGEHIRLGRSVTALWHQINERLALICIPLVAALLITAPELFAALFPPSFGASVPVFRIYTLNILFSIMPTDAALRSYAENRTLLLLSLLRGLVVLVSLHFLFTRWGLPGAVMTSLISGVLIKAGAVARISRLMHLGVGDILPWRALGKMVVAAAVATLPAVVFRAAFLAWHPLLLGAVTTLVFALAYVPVVAAFGLLPGLTWWPRWRLAAHSESE